MYDTKGEQKQNPEEKYCPQWEQKPQPDRKFCPECEQELQPEDRYCPRCGAAAVPMKGNERTRTARLSYVGLIGLAAIGVGLLCIALIVISIFQM